MRHLCRLTMQAFLVALAPLHIKTSLCAGEDAKEPAHPGLAFVFFDDTDFQRPAARNVFADRPAGPAGFNAGLPIGKNTGVDPQINMELKGYNDCSKLWMGRIVFPAAGEVTFAAEADKGVRLFVDDKAVIDGWLPGGVHQGTIQVTGGQSSAFRLEYSHRGGPAYMRLFWSWAGHPRERVSPSAFQHREADLRHAQAIADKREWVAPGNQGPSPSTSASVISVPAGDEPIKASIYHPVNSAIGPAGRLALKPAMPGLPIAGIHPGQKEATGGGPVRLGAGPHLFVDDFLIESCANVTRRVNRPARDPGIPNPIITGKEDRNFQPFLTVLRDPQTHRFRVWYGASKESKDMGSSHIGYMDSEDGIRWIRPMRVLEDPAPIQFGDSVVDDGPEFNDPAKRYKLGWWKDGGLKIAVSPDGLTWTPLVPGVVLRHNHDITNIFRDTLRGRYVATISVFTTGPTWKGKRRATMQSVSRDLLKWEKPWYILTPVDGEDEGQTQFYAMSGHIIRGDLWLGLVKVLRDDLKASGSPPGSFGIGYTTLAWTRDGEHWVRDREPFFAPDPRDGAWDHAHAWMDSQLIVGDEVYIYYGGYKNGHKANRFEERQIGLVRISRDRYVAREAGDAQGTLRMPLVILDGARMTVNAKADGELRVRLLDEAAKPLAGFDFADCTPICGDSVAHPVKWNGAPDLPRGKPVRLEFLLQKAQLYGFEL